MTSKRIVHVVDDDESVRRAMTPLLRSAGLETVAYQTAQAVLNAAPTCHPDAYCWIYRCPGWTLELLAELNQLGIQLPVIVVTGHGDIPTAVRAMKALPTSRVKDVLAAIRPPRDALQRSSSGQSRRALR
jgi:two-component system response regulator FixJ